MTVIDRDVTYRTGARAFLLTPDEEILLMRIRLDTGEFIWIAPGGGKEGDEDHESCLRRELWEELGLESFTLGPLIWRRRHTYSFHERRFSQTDDYFIVPVTRFEPIMNDIVELDVFDSFRWWKLDELASAKERLTPLSLANIMRDYRTDGIPDAIELEVLVD